MPSDPLLDPDARVPSPEGDTPLAIARRAMARWSNGEEHVRARAIATNAIATLHPEQLRSRARAAAIEHLVAAIDAIDVVELARTVPVVVLAEALGFADPVAAARHQRIVTIAIAPEEGAAPSEADEVAASLAWLLDASEGGSFGEAANRVALLHQCLDATAALIALAVLRAAREPGDSAMLVAGVLRDEPPVVATVRINTDDAAVTVPLAGRPFGAGVHRCPGEAVAVSLAEGVVDAVLASGRPRVGEVEFERRPNLRMPRSIPFPSQKSSSTTTSATRTPSPA